MISIRGLNLSLYNKLKNALKCNIDDDNTKIYYLGNNAIIDVELPRRIQISCDDDYVILTNPDYYKVYYIKYSDFEYIEIK